MRNERRGSLLRSIVGIQSGRNEQSVQLRSRGQIGLGWLRPLTRLRHRVAYPQLPRGAFVYRLGHGPLKAERRVRFPYALPVITRGFITIGSENLFERPPIFITRNVTKRSHDEFNSHFLDPLR